MTSTLRSRRRAFVSFDGATRVTSSHCLPDRYGFWDSLGKDTKLIPRGAGLSYVAASFGDEVVSIEQARFNRVLAYDEQTGTLEVEAGATLGEVFEFLSPRGRYLPIQPGHPAITIGGCVASDVHGKNPFRDGTFVSVVKSLRLFHPSHGTIELAEDKDRDLFRLTCGGFGLTGNILSVVLRTRALPGTSAKVRLTMLEDPAGLPELLRQASERAELCYSWHDFTARGGRFGRGFVCEGTITASTSSSPQGRPAPWSPLSSERRGSLPGSLFCRTTTRLLNGLYHTAATRARAEREVGLFDLLFPVVARQRYFDLFGRRGFIEYQCLIPTDRYVDFIEQVKRRLFEAPVAVTLASGKLFRGSPELLRFTGDGVCLALDFPRNGAGEEFARFLDRVVEEVGARPNLIKDSRLSAELVQAVYAGYGEFRRRLHAFDPKRLYQSHLSRRLAL